MNRKDVPRRGFIARMAAGVSAALVVPVAGVFKLFAKEPIEAMNIPSVKNIRPLGFQWDTADPFLFCVHHEDFFPKGNAEMGPATSLEGRSIGDDFIIKDGWRMYHGDTVPGFPGHPHRGFETITVVRKGFVDHADSMGAAGRYGNGDVQWMTAGKGVQHSEMFPLLKEDQDNPMELFQIWLNLPARSKMVDPHFSMLWGETIPKLNTTDAAGKTTVVEVMAGALNGHKAPAPPPNSWAAEPANEVAVFNIIMQPGATWTLPKCSEGINRTLYFYEGETLLIDGQEVPHYHAAEVLPDRDLTLTCKGEKEAGILVLQGRPIGETVIQYGPFVMNSKDEIRQAFEDYHATQFGGWPWPKYGQVHAREQGRFAKHADGSTEVPG